MNSFAFYYDVFENFSINNTFLSFLLIGFSLLGLNLQAEFKPLEDYYKVHG